MTYIDIPTDTEPADLAGSAFDFIQTFFPDWTPARGALSTIVIQANAELAAEVKDTSSKVPRSIFRYLGTALANIQPIDAAPATVDSTWTMVDNLGHTIDAGTSVVVRDDIGNFIGFSVVETVMVPEGSTVTATGGVQLRAVIAGTAGNALTGPASPQDQLAFVQSIALVGTTANGVEAEDEDTYLSRLVDELKLQSPRPLLPPDFAILARRIAGVKRATVKDNYNPADDTSDNPLMTTVFPVDANGADLSSGIRTEIKTYLETLRGQNFIVNVANPTVRTTISVFFEIAVTPGLDPAAVVQAAEDAVTTFLSPATWGVPSTGDQGFWENTPVVRINKVIQVIEDTPGVLYTQNVQLNDLPNDVTMSGPAPLPNPVSVNGALV